MKKQMELLSPAGDYECFLAAINAGCDAVYLAGDRFGARAFAGNFSTENIIKAIRHAHLFGVAVYLTVNTLFKEDELKELVPFLEPLVAAGLDAVLVQDMGVALMLRDAFPTLSLHASTQMGISGPASALLAKRMGLSRVVLARECSLSDMKEIQELADIETEAFIHGAMCYSYSGRCLFSSMLGERSANRGRCAAPCRHAYSLGHGKEKYLLSLSDLAAIDYIPKLAAANVTSLKIEGRMKPPAYVSAVTGVYRKYIDKYYKTGDRDYSIDKIHRQILEQLYHRGGLESGYLDSNRGHHPVTLEDPSYTKESDYIRDYVKENFLAKKRTLGISLKATIKKDMPLRLLANYKENKVEVLGDVAEPAQKAPLDVATVQKQLCKLGDSVFSPEKIQVDMDDGSFVPIKALNELRRKAVSALEEEIIHNYKY